MIKILAIDDNQDNLISIKALISESFPDALVLTSLTGTKGLELAAAEDPDVIFLDIVMPGMDGFEVCKRLKTDKKLRDIPVVFVTALKGDKESRIRALESGAESFLAKPIDESELTAQIRAMVKIKKAKIEKHDEKKRLAAMVEKQTLELKQNHIATLNLLEDLRRENQARKKSEAALRESENNLKDIFQSVSEGIVYSTSSGKVISINKSLEQIIGISKEKIVGNNILNLTKKLLSAKNVKKVLPALSNLLTGEDIQPFFVEYKDKILEINTSRNRDNGRLTVVIRDITEQIRAQEQLQISNQRLKLHIQNTPLAFIEFDRERQVSAWNQAAVEIFGFSIEEAIGQDWTFIIPKESWSTLDAVWDALLRQHGGSRSDNQNITKNGKIIYCEWYNTPLIDSKGEILGVASLGMNITERVQAEGAFRESQSLYHSFIEELPNPVFRKDMDGRYMLVNSQFCSLKGLTNKDIQGKTPNEVALREIAVHGKKENAGKYSDLGDNLHKQIVQTGKIFEQEEEYITPDGYQKYMHVIRSPVIDSNGTIIGTQGIMFDITERKRTDQALRLSEAAYKRVINNVDEIIYSVSFDDDQTDGKVIFVSNQVNEILGYAPEEFLQDSHLWLALIHPDDAEMVVRQTSLSFENRMFEPRIYRMKHKQTHEYVWVEDHPQFLFDESENIIGQYGTARDITGRRIAEEALKESEEFSNSLILTIPFGMDIVDRSGNILFQSENFEKIFSKGAIGSKCWDLYCDDKKQCIGCPLKQGIEIGKTDIYESSGVLGGKVFEINHTGMMFMGKEAMLEIFQDITERKLSEKKLKQSYDLLHKLAAQVPGVVYQYRLYPDGSSAFPYSSPGIYEIYEVTPEQVRQDASPVFTRIHPDDYDSIVETITESARSQKIYHNEFRVILPEQGLRWRMCEARPELLEDGSTLWYGIITDITEKKKVLEDLIEAKSRAEESDNLKTSFLNNISHEIRTPFNGILGFLAIIQEGGLTDDERDEYIGIINKSAFRLMNTINDIVEVSQIQSGQVELIASKTNIRKLVLEIYNRFQPDAENQGLNFNLRVNLPDYIKGILTDSIKLNSILTILIGNAIKFTKEGSVELEIRLADGDDNHTQIEFSVKDTGVGILKNKQQVIFERFRQADGSNTRHFEGSGLGLSIAKSYVEILGGKIWVESDPEDESATRGSVFGFTIPFINVTEEKNVSENNVSAKISAKEINDLKILIVEDDEGSALFLEMAVSIFSREVIKVTTGIDAIEACRKNPDIDLVLMDIKMPGMDGHEATRQIRQFNSGVVIIAQTAYAMIGDRGKAIESGCNDYITKPINKNKLADVMKKYFLIK